jgi:hypothetical protein
MKPEGKAVAEVGLQQHGIGGRKFGDGVIPSVPSFSVARGPMPLILRTGKGQMRASMSPVASRVKPSGFSRSEQIFDNSLLGLMPMEQLRPVASRTA